MVGSGPSLRIECRIPGADANPYLAYAALLAAAQDGIERRLDPGPPFEGDVYAAEGLPQVPHSLPEAIAELERSEFARKAFGDEVVDHYNKENFKAFIQEAKGEPELMKRYLDMIFISKSLERIADHATNLAEEVIFLTTARESRHQSSN